VQWHYAVDPGIHMILTTELHEGVKKAYVEETRNIGVPVDRLVQDVLYAHIAARSSGLYARLPRESVPSRVLMRV